MFARAVLLLCGGAIILAGCGDEDTIAGTLSERFIRGSRNELVALDASNDSIAVHVQGQDSYLQVRGDGTSGGTFRAPDVEGERRFLAWRGMQTGDVLLLYSLRDAHRLDIEFRRQGRPDVTLPTAGSSVDVSVQGLRPWATDDALLLYSPNTATLFATGLSVPDGGTSSSPQRLQWPNQVPLIDSTKGDTTYLLQTGTLAVADAGYRVAHGLAVVENFSVSDGGASDLDATLEPFAETRELRLGVPLGRLSEIANDVHPSAVVVDVRLQGRALAGWGQFGDYGPSPALLSGTFDPDAGDILQTFSFPRWSSDADQFLSLTATVGALLANPFNEAWPIWVPGTVKRQVLLDAVPDDVELGWSLTPARELRIEGQLASGELTAITEAPWVTWVAPEVGLASRYRLDVFKITPRGDGALVDSVLLAAIQTYEPSARVPPGVLESGHWYFVMLHSVAESGQERSYSMVLSSPFQAGQ